MKIYPTYELRPRYLGEQRVYEILQSISWDQGFAVHSVNLPDHEYKRWGEADFVIIGPDGVILLEIKGGNVTIAERVWRYENARAQAIVSIEGPARQAISAAVALENMLSGQLDRKVRCRWGVVFPLCTFRKELAELPSSRLADLRVCRDGELFEKWLQSIPFTPHAANDYALDSGTIARIREVLVPAMNTATSMGIAARASREQAIRLTEQQYVILESLVDTERITVSGGAGTGKTELVALSARAEKVAGRQPAIVTTPGVFHSELRDRMARYNIPVVTRELPQGTDTLIVDEGQDYMQPDLLGLLFSQLPGGLEYGRWRWFMDPNLQYLNTVPDPGSVVALHANSTTVTLTRNVRSTREIVSAIGLFLVADVGISMIDGFGLKVEFHDVPTTGSSIAECRGIVSRCLDEGMLPGDIAILGGAGSDGPVCRGLLDIMPSIFRSVFADTDTISQNHATVSYISSFRGLEGRVVLLVDLDSLPQNSIARSLLYIGMSRATASLHVLVSPVFKPFLIQLMQETFHTGPEHEQE